MSDMPRKTETPDSPLGFLADAMLKTLHAEGDEGVRAIVMLHRGNEGMTALSGYEDDENIDAVADLFQYLQRLMEANGRTLEIIGIPDHPPTS